MLYAQSTLIIACPVEQLTNMLSRIMQLSIPWLKLFLPVSDMQFVVYPGFFNVKLDIVTL